MDRLIYTALSGATQTLLEQQISANNLANVNTNGFRADMAMASNDKVKGGGFDTRFMAKESPSGVNDSTGVAEKPSVRSMSPFREPAISPCRIKPETKFIPATAISSRTIRVN
jgi:flagellar basal body rod protein FlgG